MKFINNFDTKKSLQLIGLSNQLNILKNLIDQKKFPNVTLLSGNKGIGKCTLINHLMFYLFDNKNYNIDNNTIKEKTDFYLKFKENLFPNILFLGAYNHKNVKIDDVRNLKDKLLKTPLINNKRFIILDDVEMFNLNSLNGLLKIIEEPGKNNHFILIYNKSKKLLETIRSRCLEMKISINELERVKIIDYLVKNCDQQVIFDKYLLKVSPGNYLKFNNIFIQNDIKLNNNYLENLNKLLNLYKKEQDIFFKDTAIYYSEYFLRMNSPKNFNFNKIFMKNRHFLVKSINDFFLLNLNQNTLLNSIKSRFINV